MTATDRVECECWGRQSLAGVFFRKLCSATSPTPPGACHTPLPSRHLKQAFPYGPMGYTPSGQLSFLLCSSTTGQLTSPLDSKSRGQVGRGTNGRWTMENHETGRPSGVMPMSTGSALRHNHQSPILSLAYTKGLGQGTSFGLQFPHQYYRQRK